MTGPTGHSCPECGAPKERDNTASCGCARQAGEALRDTRTAEAAAAEDFGPLRIRPYVGLDTPSDPAEPPHPSPVPDGPEATAPTAGAESESASDSMPDVRLTVPAADEGPEGGEGEGRPRRRPRPVVLVSVAAAVIALIAAAALASGLLSYVTPSRDGAAPQEVREGVPDAASSSPAGSAAAPAGSAPPPTSAASSPSPAASATPSPSATTTAPESPAATTASAEPTQTATLTGTAASASPTSAPVLRRGDQGTEVTELQLRLHQVNLYLGAADGDYSRQVEDAVRTYQWSRGIHADEPGVYDAATRAKLESETSEP